MRLGALLMVIGLILVLVDFAVGYVAGNRRGLLHAGVMLIGIGVLIGHTTVHSS